MKLLAPFFCIFITAVFSSGTPVCTNGYTLVNNKCLKLYTNTVTHKVAERSCMVVGATLVTVKNAIDNRALSTFVGSSSSLLWLGLYCVDSDTSRCLWDDSTGAADMYDNFASGFPFIDIGKCVYYSVKGALAGQWLSGDCEQETRAFVCELPYTYADSCPYNYNGHCYTFHGSAAFVQAQMACEQECGNLASINSPNENRYLTTMASRNTSFDYVLIGALWPTPIVFSWIDGSPWVYNNVDPNLSRANANCVILSSKASNRGAIGQWVSTSCTAAFNFICKRPAGVTCDGSPPPVTVTPVPSNPSYCNSSLLLAPGVITSPNFPNNYGNNLYCVYQLATFGSYNILLKFTDFYTESVHDKVSVYDGDSMNSPSIGSYSGNLAAFVVTSTGNAMTVAFRTDGSVVFQGFSARVLSYSY